VTVPTLAQVRTIAVIGAGTMGHGIAHVASAMGAQVRVYDTLAGGARAGIDKVAKKLAKGVELGKLSAADREAALGRLSASDDLAAACRDVDCVIEAVPERIELKREIFEIVDTAAPPHALLATNTSSLPFAQIAAAVRDGSRLVGMHFFNPVHVMKLVEIVRHPGASDAAVALAVALASP
jgi:3-hydroxybutyryl-CoA dehydrogenase